MLGAAVLPRVGTHPLRILRRVVDGARGSHEGRRGPHGVEHVRAETCRNKVVRFRQSNGTVKADVLLLETTGRKQLAYSCA